MKKNITIYDVAREAGVSLATVSRVINGANVVKPDTRDRVLEAIQRLDFKPNQIARGLATSKTTTIAIVFPQSLFAHVKNMIPVRYQRSSLMPYLRREDLHLQQRIFRSSMSML